VEVIVVDDSPEASARPVAESLADPRITYLQNPTPSGGRPALVRNVGWQRAQGRFVHFLDDDDHAAAGYYRAAIAAFEANPERGVVLGRIEPFGDADDEMMAHERAFFDLAARRCQSAAEAHSRLRMVANLLFSDTVLVNSACLVRREHVAALGGYDAEVPMNEDVDFYARAIRRYGFLFLDQVVLHYRIVKSSLMHGRTDNDVLTRAYERMYSQYRASHGAAELLAIKIFSRTILRLLQASPTRTP
jgi:GT2 family glycosyltransferase